MGRPAVAAMLVACALAAGCATAPARMSLLGRVVILDDGEPPPVDVVSPKVALHPEFFRRVNAALTAAWRPDVAYLRHEQHPLSGKRSVVVRTELAAGGALKEVTLLASSGSSYLDEDAVASVRRAAPFKKPPPALAAPDGSIRFNIGFLIDLAR